jgi:hypothetical protein
VPRLSKVEACLICGFVPCECSSKKPKTQVQVKRAPATEPVDRAGGSSMRDKMKAAAAAAPQPLPSSLDLGRRGNPRAPGCPTEVFSRRSCRQIPTPTPCCIRPSATSLLLLHPDELERYSMLVGSAPTTKDRAAFWRAGREALDGTVPQTDSGVASATQASNG